MLAGPRLTAPPHSSPCPARCPELLSGWNGPIIENQTLFDILDGAMILASLVTLNLLHPLWLLPRKGPTPSNAAMPLTGGHSAEDVKL
jgi:hypothetical protein